MNLSFNLVIEVLLVSRKHSRPIRIPTCRFNLVIEVLLVSRTILFLSTFSLYCRFNLVIEVLLVSSQQISETKFMEIMFQSRNRGSFGFKLQKSKHAPVVIYCFNLVIEVLLVSRNQSIIVELCRPKFQSRNRGSFGFKFALSLRIKVCSNSVSIS